MEVLIVYTHPNPRSFNRAVLEAFTRGLGEGGHTFEVVDLYAIGFDPRLGLADYVQFTGKQMPQDILEQQEKVARADALVFIHPIWWVGWPAMLKGWIDRVFSYGFAYQFTERGGIEGLLKYKKALLINTTYYSEEDYEFLGIRDAMEKTLVEFTLKCCGIQDVKYVFLYSVEAVDNKTRWKYLEQVFRLGKELQF